MNQNRNHWFCPHCGFNNSIELSACQRCQFGNPFPTQPPQPQKPQELAKPIPTKIQTKPIMIGIIVIVAFCGMCGFLGIIRNLVLFNSSMIKSGSNPSPSFSATPSNAPSATATSRVAASKPQAQQSSFTRGSSSDRNRLANRIGRDMTANRVPSC